MAIAVFVADEQSTRPVEPSRWMGLAEAVLSAEGVSGDAELSVLFVEEEDMAQLNQRFLGEDGPTDVLAFAIDEEPVESGRSPDSGGTGPGWVPAEPTEMPTLLGDVVICPSVAWRNAPDHAGTYEDELALRSCTASFTSSGWTTSTRRRRRPWSTVSASSSSVTTAA